MPNKQKSTAKHPQNVAYKSTNRRHRNKMIKLKRHIARFPEDEQAIKSLELIRSMRPGIKGKPKWVTKYKNDPSRKIAGVKNNRLFKYREQKHGN